MEESDKVRLRRNRCALVDDIEPSRILDRLIELKVFTPDMSAEITSQAAVKDQISKLLNMLEKRGPDAYSNFRKTLLEMSYQHLVKKLDNTQISTDEVDARAQRNEQGVTTNVYMRKDQGKESHCITNNVKGDNNFAIFGAENLTINHYN